MAPPKRRRSARLAVDDDDRSTDDRSTDDLRRENADLRRENAALEEELRSLREAARSPSILERFVEEAPDVFAAHVLPRFDNYGDLAVLAMVNRQMRGVVFESPVGDVRWTGAAVSRQLAKLRRVDQQARVGVGARVSVEREDVRVHREGWKLGGREVGEGTRMPVGRGDLRRSRG
jgi:hypothetical protein